VLLIESCVWTHARDATPPSGALHLTAPVMSHVGRVTHISYKRLAHAVLSVDSGYVRWRAAQYRSRAISRASFVSSPTWATPSSWPHSTHLARHIGAFVSSSARIALDSWYISHKHFGHTLYWPIPVVLNGGPHNTDLVQHRNVFVSSPKPGHVRWWAAQHTSRMTSRFFFFWSLRQPG
jgi:hypothetical protein